MDLEGLKLLFKGFVHQIDFNINIFSFTLLQVASICVVLLHVAKFGRNSSLKHRHPNTRGLKV